MTPHVESIELPTGVTLRYAEQGDASGVTVLLLHGLSDSWRSDKIEVPTLIVRGEKDEYCPRGTQEAITAAIADSRLAVYPGAGHGVHWEEPERFASDLVAFVEGLDHFPVVDAGRQAALRQSVRA